MGGLDRLLRDAPLVSLKGRLGAVNALARRGGRRLARDARLRVGQLLGLVALGQSGSGS